MPGDRHAYNTAVSEALSADRPASSATWENAESGNGGIIRAGRSYANADGQLCRTYRATVAFTDEILGGDGSACRRADGEWTLAADALG